MAACIPVAAARRGESTECRTLFAAPLRRFAERRTVGRTPYSNISKLWCERRLDAGNFYCRTTRTVASRICEDLRRIAGLRSDVAKRHRDQTLRSDVAITRRITIEARGFCPHPVAAEFGGVVAPCVLREQLGWIGGVHIVPVVIAEDPRRSQNA